MFPIDLSKYQPVTLDLKQSKLSKKKLRQLEVNIQLLRDLIVFFTAYAGARGLGGHTGGAYDIVPEALIAEGFMRRKSNKVVPVLWDAAGHRVALQYALAALDPSVPAMTLKKLLDYRAYKGGLYGHPEKDLRLGIKFSSGRLGHLWSYVNGVAVANPGKKVIVFTSDGSLQEGNGAEAARFSVAQQLKLVVSVDDNNVTISGHPKDYLPGYNIAKTLRGHGLSVDTGNPEDIPSLYRRMRKAFLAQRPAALVNKRAMAIGIPDVQGKPKAHDVIPTDSAIKYLTRRGHHSAVEMLRSAKKVSTGGEYLGSSSEWKKNRSEFGTILCDLLSKLSKKERVGRVRVFDCDLAGSTGLSKIKECHPEIFVEGGVMERHNYAAAAGFGTGDRQGIVSTFSAFLEMVISDITMARLNNANVLAHFSHAGVDWMADSNCHYGVNNFFADNGLDETSKLYFPADALQLRALLKKVLWHKGLRFVFSTRSPVPLILDSHGKPFFRNYTFKPGKDDVIRTGRDGYIISYGEMLYRSLHAVETLRKEGIHVGLINKATLNMIDESAMKRVGKAPFVLVVESQNTRNALGSRFGTWLLERGFSPRYARLGTHTWGAGGISEHIPHQGLDPKNIIKQVKLLFKKCS